MCFFVNTVKSRTRLFNFIIWIFIKYWPPPSSPEWDAPGKLRDDIHLKIHRASVYMQNGCWFISSFSLPWMKTLSLSNSGRLEIPISSGMFMLSEMFYLEVTLFSIKNCKVFMYSSILSLFLPLKFYVRKLKSFFALTIDVFYIFLL